MSSKFYHDDLLESIGLLPKTKGMCNEIKKGNDILMDISKDHMNTPNQKTIKKSNTNDDNQYLKKKLFSMTVDLPNMTTDTIYLYENDDPIEISTQFCMKHGLNKKFFGIITETLLKNSSMKTEKEPVKHQPKKDITSTFDELDTTIATWTKQSSSLLSSADPKKDPLSLGTYVIDPMNQKSDNNFNHSLHSNESFEHLSDAQDILTNSSNSIEYFNARSIFERLHNDAKLKSQRLNELKKENIKEYIHNPRRGSESINQKCLELYADAINKQQKMQKLRQDQDYERENQENENCTFKPKINPKSNKIASERMKSANRIEQILDEEKKIEAEREMIRHKNAIAEIEKYTFKPQINEMSHKIVNDLKGSVIRNVFEDLYNEYKLLIQKRIHEKIKSNVDYSFTPMTNRNYTQKPNISFLERVQQYIEDKKIRDIVESVDNSEHEDLTFKPQINRGPKFSRNSENLPIGDYLYNNKADLEQHKQDLLDKAKLEQESKLAKASEKSVEILEHKKRKRYEEIFKDMDSDGDGIITPQKIELNTLPTEMLEILSPLLIEMDQLNAQLDLESFCKSVDKLMKTLDTASKDKILYNPNGKSKGNSIKSNQDHAFKPQINKKSIMIAEGNRFNHQGDMYERLKAKQEYSKAKLKEIQEQKEEQELKECTFHPMIFKKNNN